MKKRFHFRHLLPGLSLAFTLFVFAPVDLYVFYGEELWFPLTYLLRWLAVFAAAAFAGITLLVMFLPKKASLILSSAVYAVSFLAHIQGSFLLLNYGELDGRTIDWSAYTVPYLLDALLWIAVIALFVFLAIRFREKFRKVLEIAACALLGIQILSLSFQLVSISSQKERTEVTYLSRQGLYTVSPEENTVVFVLDAFDSLLFEQLKEEYPEQIGRLCEDFTFYPDTAGGAIRTKFALPFMLTGTTNREEKSYLQYLSDSFAASPLIQELATGKYDSGLYTSSHYIDMTRTDAFGNIAQGSPAPLSRLGITGQYLKLVAFRCLPSAFSRFFWMYSGDFEQYKSASPLSAYALNDIWFHNDLTSQKLAASAQKNSFRFFHLNGPHEPYTMDENCARNEESDETRQAIGSLRIVSEYLEQMKTLGVYDRATVIVTADHGSTKHSELGQSPLFLVKFPGASHPLDSSDLPLSFVRLPDILASALRGGLTSMDEWKASSPRYFYVKSQKGSVESITEYAINGPVMNTVPEKTGIVFHENTAGASRHYVPGTVLYFDERDTARCYIVSGISGNDGTNTWTSGHDSEMLFELPETPGQLRLRLGCRSYNETQTVEVWVNDQLVETFSVSGTTSHLTFIPAGTVTGTELRLRLHFPDAVSPASLGYSTDDRLLALSLDSLTISAVGP